MRLKRFNETRTDISEKRIVFRGDELLADIERHESGDFDEEEDDEEYTSISEKKSAKKKKADCEEDDKECNTKLSKKQLNLPPGLRKAILARQAKAKSKK